MSLPPGSWLGVLGSGQLGRMLTMAAKRLGYRVAVYSPDENTPAGQVADREVTADYRDEEALRRFARSVDVVTIEFENVPAETLEAIARLTPVYPQATTLKITQNRLLEKTFLSEAGIAVTPFRAIHHVGDLADAVREIGCPAVLKTAQSGYDGKGQMLITHPEEAMAAYQRQGASECILEGFVDLEREVSVIAARTPDGAFAAYEPVENRHRNHILDLTLAPARLPESLAKDCIKVAKTIMDGLEMQGLLCVEFFITRDGRLLVNELAPRAHNSGHYSIEAAVCDQFEQQVRAVCGLPLGDVRLLHPAAMANLLGDLWQTGEPNWNACLALSPVYLHLYGKEAPKPGRKMGHLTALADTPEAAAELALQAREALMTRLTDRPLQSGYR